MYANIKEMLIYTIIYIYIFFFIHISLFLWEVLYTINVSCVFVVSILFYHTLSELFQLVLYIFLYDITILCLCYYGMW
jgi:hypothetical protein